MILTKYRMSASSIKAALWSLVIVGVFASPGVVQAQDKPASKPAKPVEGTKKDGKDKPTKEEIAKEKQAIEEAKKAMKHAARLVNSNIKQSEEYALKAVELYPNYLRARAFLGWLYNVRLGDVDRSMKQYDYIIRHTRTKTLSDKKLKAEALSNKGTLIFIKTRDANKAIEYFTLAINTYPSWEYADKASNLYVHVGDNTKAFETGEKAYKSLVRLKKKLDIEVKRFQGAKKRKSQERLAQVTPQLTKVAVHLAACKQLLGKPEEAKKYLAGIEEYPRVVKYNLAILRAAQGNPVGCLNCLEDFMRTRNTAKARNQLRQFIREEPSFMKFANQERFKKLVQDEKIEDDKEKK